ncbi:MAG: monomethylamine:corrinoid methyltransferase [Proteobacteria bacterium]|nr:monomethylamine:corrinoid methyltransferase [Pseudomonadota bacterium]
MLPMMDIQNRAETGPVMKSKEFDLLFARKIRELTPKYNIKYDAEQLIADDATADAIFQAGVELLAEVGLYNIDTQRVIKFSRQELQQVVENARTGPDMVMFGLGKDEVCYQHRTGKDKRPPVLAAGAHGGGTVPIRQEWFSQFVQSFVQEESNQALAISGGVPSVDGIPIKVGTPSEVYCALWENKAMLEVLQRLGRPDMHLGLHSSVTSIGGFLALVHEGFRGRHNIQLSAHVMPELKVDWSRLTLALIVKEWDFVPWVSGMSVEGALCRGPEETAVGMIASMLGQLAYSNAIPAQIWNNTVRGEWTRSQTLWANGAATRAAERNVRLPIGGMVTTEEKFRGTEASLYWEAAASVLYTACGFGYCWSTGWSGLEARFVGEILSAVAGMDEQKANKLAKTIYDRWIVEKEHAQQPKDFPELYDLKTVQPKEDWLSSYNRVKDELARMGVPYK